MARVILPESSIKARRLRRRAILLWGSAVTLLLLCGGGVWLANASFLRIKTIEAVGAKTVAAEALTAQVERQITGSYLSIFPKDNIFLYPKKTIVAQLLTAYPTLKNVSVRAENFSTISITALDREPRALWCGKTLESIAPCLLLDEDGVVYAEAPEFSESPYARYFGTLSGEGLPGQYLSSETFRSLAALVDAMAQHQTENKVESVFVDEEKDARILFKNGFVLIFVLTDDGGEVFERFTLALTAEPFKNHTLAEFEYLDLRFGDKLYYKMK